MNKKAIVLLSGGLDSILAAKLMLEQGVDVEAVHYYIGFASCGGDDGPGGAEQAASALGIKFTKVDITEEYLEVFKNPAHGYGANVNPCIDCKIFMLRKAKKYMESIGASFLVTGEVLGERPMSQRRDALNIIEKAAGVRGILLRPLTAKHLEPTIPEKEGVVDREKLGDIIGRSRKPQIAMAEKFGIIKFPNPAGGCLLTDPGFARRVKDLIEHNEVNVENLNLLKIGRHFRISDKAKLALGRNEKENDLLVRRMKDGYISLEPKDVPGPFAVLVGTMSENDIDTAARVTAYHTKQRGEKSLNIEICKGGPSACRTVSVAPAALEEVEKIRL
ncbi:MAG: hypothetical protein WC779_00510 [Candidatus Omnitrophota bacterium]|jgi:tRNA U34 2-thiouridine synthase MnmA/TrmU